MNKAIAIEILSALLADREVSKDRIFGETFQAMLDARMVAFDGHEPVIMPRVASIMPLRRRLARSPTSDATIRRAVVAGPCARSV